MSQYKVLSRAQLSYDYLHTNSTTHEFLFGGLAELLDNARDASATKINIYTVPEEESRGGYMLCFLDDGEGMDQGEAADIITFGKSLKKTHDSQMIGMYGNGLKSGSMRIGNDLMLFTKKGPTMTCVFLSRTFHEEEGIDEIVVPMPAFDSQSKKPITRTPKEKEKHRLEMDLILKYSPFKTEALFMKEFDKIEGASGTLVIITNLKLLDTGEPELDVKTDPYDIILAHPDGNEFDSDDGLMPERKSFRAYASILYVDPRMRIYIQGKKVRTKRLANCLFKPRHYKYSSGRFKTRSENETMKAKEEAKIADNRAKEVESKARNLETKYGNGSGTKDQRADLRKTQTQALELRKEAQLRKQIADRKLKSLREPKTLSFIFGININDRNQDGMFVYNCSRLIKMYQKVGPQADGGVFCSGVVGVVDVPYLVLEPTHNKQDFADAKEYRHLQRAMGEHVVQYWKDIAIAQQGVTKFWENFGYISPNWRDPPSHDPKFIRKRAMQIQITLQCDLCLKWRILPFSANNIGKNFPDDWVCSMNPDPAHNRCSAPEQKLNIPEGILKKEVKSREEKAKDLEEDIKKKQDQLDKIQKNKPVLSSRQIKEEEQELERELELKREKEEERQEMIAEQRKKAVTISQRIVASGGKSSPQSKPQPSRSAKRPVSQATVDSESDLDDFDDESEGEVLPPPRKRPVPKIQPKPKSRMKSRTGVLEKIARRRGRPTEEEDEEDEEYEEPPRRRGRPTNKESDDEIEEEKSHRRNKHESITSPEPDDGSPGDDTDTDMGSKVEVRVQNKWVKATVVEFNHKQKKWKLKFDKHPQSRNDKWYDRHSSDVRLLSENQPESTNNVTASSDVQDGVAEAPSSSTVASSSGTMAQMTEDIANGYRTCLRYFLPPQWAMDKEAVSTLTIQELSGFPLDDFFDHYEKGLRKLVSSFQLEAQTRQHEAEQIRTKLSSVRKMIAKLLKSINEEFDIDPECDTDQVDELLALCVKQATQQLGEEK